MCERRVRFTVMAFNENKDLRVGHFVIAVGTKEQRGYPFTYRPVKKGGKIWCPSQLENGMIKTSSYDLILEQLGHYAPLEVEKLWNQAKRDIQNCYLNGDMLMADESYVADIQYYPHRITFENGEYEILIAEGRFEDGVFPVDYNPDKNFSKTGEKYIF